MFYRGCWAYASAIYDMNKGRDEYVVRVYGDAEQVDSNQQSVC
jgi:hypothetical protein